MAALFTSVLTCTASIGSAGNGRSIVRITSIGVAGSSQRS